MDETPISMIAIRDPITAGRISMIMRQRGWASKIIGDDNDILGQYLNLKPRVTFLGLEVGSSTGEIVALRIKEVDSQARIVFVSSRSKSDLVRQASYSAGAVERAVDASPSLGHRKGMAEDNGRRSKCTGLGSA